MTLKIVAQKLVTIESFKAKIASGCINAFQKLPSPLLVPNMNIEASGSSTSGSIITITVTMLSGLTTSKPRTCLIPETVALIFKLERGHSCPHSHEVRTKAHDLSQR